MMRAEYGERVVRSAYDNFHGYDPADPSDRGPHVDRVGLIAVDADFVPDANDNDPPPDA